jgi:circadian clock protein KaiC
VSTPVQDLIPSGIPGLDLVLHGGLRRGRMYFVEGESGTGKTTLALQFAHAGLDAGERVLIVSLSETIIELQLIAASHGWALDGIALRDLSEESAIEGTTKLFHISEIHLEERIQAVLREIEAVRPQRLVIDTLSSLRVLSEQPGQLRHHLEDIQHRLGKIGATTLIADETSGNELLHPRSLAWGILRLEQQLSGYGPARRRLHIQKMRGQSYSSGYHDVRIRTGGLHVYPRLAPESVERHSDHHVGELVLSGIPELDALLGGGIERGTSLAVLGPPGCGKSTLCTQFGVVFAQRGERVGIYLFDESTEVFCLRARRQGLDLDAEAPQAKVTVRAINPAELSPGEFAWELSRAVEEEGVRLIVIDSLNGYLQAMPDERFMSLHVHDLLAYLSQQGVITLTTLAQPNPVTGQAPLPIELSLLADTVITQRYFEATGTVRYAMSVLKKRFGDHERTIREHRIGPNGLTLGGPLAGFRGVLLASPEYLGGEAPPL